MAEDTGNSDVNFWQLEWYRPRRVWWRLHGWFSVQRMGKSRLIKTSYIWFILVPILATVLNPLPEDIKVPLFDSAIPLKFALPFRWKVFYFMSVSFAIAQGIFALSCPFLIKNFTDFRDYRLAHTGTADLSNRIYRVYLERDFVADEIIGRFSAIIGANAAAASINESFQNLISQRLGNVPDPQGTASTELNRILANFSGTEIILNDVFDLLRNYDSSDRPILGLLSLFFFGLGFLLFIWLAAQSFWTVFWSV